MAIPSQKMRLRAAKQMAVGFYICRINSLIFLKPELNMKKLIFGMLAVASLGLGSCGEKLLTEAEIAAAVAKGVEAQTAAVTAEMDSKCQADFDARVTAEAQRIVEDTRAAQEAEKAAAMEAAKAAKGKKK